MARWRVVRDEIPMESGPVWVAWQPKDPEDEGDWSVWLAMAERDPYFGRMVTFYHDLAIIGPTHWMPIAEWSLPPDPDSSASEKGV